MKIYDNTEGFMSPVQQAAGGTAIVTLVFGVFIAVLLGIHLYQYSVTDPARALELEALKTEYAQHPADSKLAERIHTLDIAIRRDQFARLYFLQRGTVLLVADLTVLIAAVLIRTRHWRAFTLPEAHADRKKEQLRHAVQVRTAVTLVTIVLAAAGLYLVQRPSEKFAHRQEQDTQPAARTYATFEETLAQWPAFRGPEGLGVTTLTDLPDDWDGPSGRHILWKSAIPLPGHNSPVVWEDRVFLTGATETQQQVFCFNLTTGALVWTGDVAIADDPARTDMYIMEDTGYAAPTVVTNGIAVAAIFADGEAACFGVDGKKLWQQHLGVPESAYGYAASLTSFENTIIVQYDVTYEIQSSRLIALDWRTGRIVWQTPRPVPNSWSSPTVVKVGDAPQVLTSGSPWVIAYDPRTGRELYRADCLGGDVASTQVYANQKIFAIEPYSAIVAAGTEGAAGDVTQTHIDWHSATDGPDICSPLTNGDLVWTVTTNGLLTAFDTRNGSEVYSHALKTDINASPSLVDRTLYILTIPGTMILAESGRTYHEIKRLELGEKCFASPAFAPGRIVIRGESHLYCIGEMQ